MEMGFGEASFSSRPQQVLGVRTAVSLVCVCVRGVELEEVLRDSGTLVRISCSENYHRYVHCRENY